jgi:hypothetical protein
VNPSSFQLSQGTLMLIASYAAATAAMLGATLYLIFRLRLFLTTTTMLIGALLLVYGPAFLSFTLSSGETGFLIHRLSGFVGEPLRIFSDIKARVPDFDGIIVAMNFSIALMYIGVITGIEAVHKLAPMRAVATQAALASWNSHALQDDAGSHGTLLVVISALVLLMLYFSVTENHLGTILKFFSIKGDNDARNLFRLHFASSPNYFYRVVLGAVAPMFIIWGFLGGASSRSCSLLLAACLLFGVTMIGKIETLSKAPPAFFLVQLMLAALLTFTNKISWKVALFGAVVVSLVIYATTRLVIIFSDGKSVLEAVYSRAFEAESQSLLENFATFPAIHPHMWGAGIRPIAMLMGVPYVPTYSIVANTWYGTYNVTSPSLFIADAWADFSYAGVIAYSLLAGVVSRSVDLIFLAKGKSAIAIAVLGATFMGVFILLTTALNTALLSGGLLLAPMLALVFVTTTRHLTRVA